MVKPQLGILRIQMYDSDYVDGRDVKCRPARRVLRDTQKSAHALPTLS
jgi:hypothetical protein